MDDSDSACLYSVRLRAESLWASGRPTFDAFYAANYSYADGPNIVGPHSVRTDATGARRPEIAMTPVEVLALHAALSAVTHPGDSVGVARLRAWLRANPSVRTRFPGDLIMSRFGYDPPR